MLGSAWVCDFDCIEITDPGASQHLFLLKDYLIASKRAILAKAEKNGSNWLSFLGHAHYPIARENELAYN